MGDVTIHVIYLKTDLRSSNSWKAELEETRFDDFQKVCLIKARFHYCSNGIIAFENNPETSPETVSRWNPEKKIHRRTCYFHDQWSTCRIKSHTPKHHTQKTAVHARNHDKTIAAKSLDPQKRMIATKHQYCIFFQNTQVQRRSCFAGESYFVSIFHFPTSFDTTEMVSDSLVRGRRGFWLESWLKKSEAMEKYQCVHHVL